MNVPTYYGAIPLACKEEFDTPNVEVEIEEIESTPVGLMISNPEDAQGVGFLLILLSHTHVSIAARPPRPDRIPLKTIPEVGSSHSGRQNRFLSVWRLFSVL